MTDDLFRNWWKRWIAPDTSTARAVRARLRRAHDWQEAMLEPVAINLAQQLGALKNEARLPMALSLAAVLAHVKEDAPGRIMRGLGYKTTPNERGKASEQPVLAPQRFTRLLRSTPDELPVALIRLVRLARNSANVNELGKAAMYWTQEYSRERQRKVWAFDYYAASNDAPPNLDPQTSALERINP